MTLKEITKIYAVLKRYLKQVTGEDKTLRIASFDTYRPRLGHITQDDIYIEIDFYYGEEKLNSLELRTQDKENFEIWTYDDDEAIEDGDITPPKIRVF